MGPKSNDCCPYRRGGDLNHTRRKSCEDRGRGFCKSRSPKVYEGPSEARRDAWSDLGSLRASRRDQPCLISDFWPVKPKADVRASE